MAISVLVEGGGGTTSEALQEQAVVIGGPSVAVCFAEWWPLAVEVQGGGVAVAILAPGYNEQLVGAQRLNDLLDVATVPVDGSLLQYREAEGRWIAGCRLVFRPALRAYVISQ